MASQPLPKYYRKAYQDFTEGLASRPNPLVINANQFAQLDNAVINETDILQKAPGYVLDGSPFPNSTDSFIRMLVNYRVGTSVNTLVCAAQDTANSSTTNTQYWVDLKQSYGDGTYNYIGHTDGTATFTNASPMVTGIATLWTKHLKAGDHIKPNAHTNWIEILSVNSDTSITLVSNYTDTTVTGGAYMARILLNKVNIPNSVIFNNKLIIVNGSETPMSFNNTSLTKIQSVNAEPASFCVKHKNRIFMLNWPGNPSGMLWSAVNDETTINAASFASVFPQDNGNIVSAVSYANSLVVFKDNGTVYQVTGEFDQDAIGQPASIIRIDVPDNIGVIAGRTCIVLEDNSGVEGRLQMGSKLYFLAETGIYTINSWMQVTKVSWGISPDVTNLLLKSTITATNAFNFTAKAQWDTGTINSLSDTRVINGMSTFFDSLNIANAAQVDGAVSCAIGSNNDIHIAWLDSTQKKVNYTHWLAADNTSSTTTVTDTSVGTQVGAYFFSARFDCVSIAVAANGNVGIASKLYEHGVGGSPAVSNDQFQYIFSELSAGAWSSSSVFIGVSNPFATPIHFENYAATATGLSVLYTSDSNPRIVTGQANHGGTNDAGFPGFGIEHLSRTGSTWTNTTITANSDYYTAISFFISANGDYHVVANVGNIIYYFKSTNSGASWTTPLTSSSLAVAYLTCAGTSPAIGSGTLNISQNENSDIIVTYNFQTGTGGDVGKTVQVNVTPTTPVTTYDDSAINSLKGAYCSSTGAKFLYMAESQVEKYIYDKLYSTGTASFTNGSKTVVGTGTKFTTWVTSGDIIKLGSDSVTDYATVDTVNSDTSITLLANYAGTTASGAYLAKQRISVSGPSANVSASWRVGDRGLVANSNVLGTVAFGLNAGEIVVRRVSVFGKWTSAVESDSNLTQWSTYAVTNPVVNGNTIVYQSMVSTTSSLLEGNNNTIIPGSVISTDATSTFIKATVTFIFNNFAQSSIQSLTLNYVGIGADAKLPTSYVYNNEMYLATTKTGQAGNSQMLFLDRRGAWGNWTQGATAFARYNQQLYSGSSTNGNIYKLRQGYNFNGSTYSLTAISKEDLLGSLELKKDIYKVYVIYAAQTNGSFTFSYRLDNFQNPLGSAWTDQVIDQTVDGLVEIPIGQTCTSIQFKVSQDGKDVQIGLVGFIILYGYLNIR